MRTKTRVSPSWPEATLKTEYVAADWLCCFSEIACKRGGQYVFKGDLAPIEETPGRAAAIRNSPLAHYNYDLIQR